MTLSIATFLTLTTQQNAIVRDLPKVSYIKAIDIWLIGCQSFIFATLIEYAFAQYLHRNYIERTSNNKTDQTVTGNNSNLCKSINLTRLKKEEINLDQQSTTNVTIVTKWPKYIWSTNDDGQKVDLFARFLFPSFFLLFCLVYWCIYALIPKFKIPDHS